MPTIPPILIEQHLNHALRRVQRDADRLAKTVASVQAKFPDSIAVADIAAAIDSAKTVVDANTPVRVSPPSPAVRIR